MGRSRGGLTTKIHALTSARGLPRDFELTPGQTHDLQGAEGLLKDLTQGEVVLGDKAYETDRLRRRIERFFNKIKHCRRIATRFKKLGAKFLAMIKLASVRILPGHYVSMA